MSKTRYALMLVLTIALLIVLPIAAVAVVQTILFSIFSSDILERSESLALQCCRILDSGILFSSPLSGWLSIRYYVRHRDKRGAAKKLWVGYGLVLVGLLLVEATWIYLIFRNESV